MRKAEKFKSGETLRSDIGPKLNRIVDLVNREIKGDQKTIMVSEVGKTISIKAKRSVTGGGGGGGGDGGTTSYPCKITGAPTGNAYPVNIHADGKNETATDTGTLEVLDLHVDEILPVDTWVVGHSSTVRTTGDG